MADSRAHLKIGGHHGLGHLVLLVLIRIGCGGLGRVEEVEERRLLDGLGDGACLARILATYAVSQAAKAQSASQPRPNQPGSQDPVSQFQDTQ